MKINYKKYTVSTWSPNILYVEYMTNIVKWEDRNLQDYLRNYSGWENLEITEVRLEESKKGLLVTCKTHDPLAGHTVRVLGALTPNGMETIKSEVRYYVKLNPDIVKQYSIEKWGKEFIITEMDNGKFWVWT